MRITAAILFIVLNIFVANAQNPDTVSLGEVLILQERMPIKISETGRSISVVTAADIKKMNVVSLNEVLSYVNGVDLRQRGPMGVQGDVGIRGGSFDQTLVLINGMKVSDPQTGHHALNLPIPVENIERIEVIKGPAARLYGPNAYSGAINIVTKPGSERAVDVSAVYGQNQLYGANATLNLPGKKLNQMLSLSANGSDTFTYNTDFSTRNVLYQAQADVNGWGVDFIAAANGKKFGANDFYTTAFPDQYEETETYFSGLTVSKNLGDNLKLIARVYGRQHNDRFLLKRFEPSFYENLHSTNTWATEISGQTNLGKAALNFGIDTRNEMIKSTNLDTHQRQINGVYLDVKYPLGKFLLNPGINVSSITGFGPKAFPGIDVAYQINNKSKVFANWGTAFRVPTFTDLYYVGPENIGNAALEAETAENYEVGFKYNNKRFTSSLAFFRKEAKNAIEWVRTNDSTKWQPQNFTQLKTQGFEANINYVPIRGFVSINLSGTFLNMDFGVESGYLSKYQIESIKEQVILRVNHKIYKNLSHSFSARYINRFHFANPYMLVDSRLNWQGEKFNLFFEATNLFNQQYFETNLVQMPGRWIRLGGNLRIGF